MAEPGQGDGRDEVNLAEFPLSLLSDRPSGDQKTLTFSDTIHDRQAGRPVTRTLTVTGSDQHGLPTAADTDVLLALIQLTQRQNHCTNSTVTFTRYELCRLLHWDSDGQHYQRLEEALNRWVGVTL